MFEVIEVGGVKTVTARSACNHVYVVDVSGSMYHDLPKIRQSMKNIISLVAQEQDTFSVIYFSGRGQCGVVFENVLVSDVSTVSMMHDAIDRFIKPIGLTGFVDPLQKAMELNLDPSKVNNFIMMTDGYDNQSNRDTIMEKVAKLPSFFHSISFIEYGFYADRDMITKMAAATNATHIFAEGVEKYETAFSDVIAAVPRVNQIDVKVNKAAKHCVFVYNGQIRIVGVVDGLAKVPEDVDRVHSIVPKDVLSKQLSADHLYLILFYAAKQSLDELVWNVLGALGDVALINKYSNAFTKQELSDFEAMVESAVLDKTKRGIEGIDTSLVPSKNAPTVLNLLGALAEGETQLVISSPHWNYKRTGRGSSSENELPRFIQSPLSQISMKGLVYSSERPNVSISTTLNGVVELPENDHGLSKVRSFITRNYTIVKDGILNVDFLPVLMDAATAESVKHFPHEVIENVDGQCYWVFNLRRVPVINRSMVENIKLEDVASVITELHQTKADIKVAGFLVGEKGGTTDKIKGLVDAHGEEAAKWLSSIGVRDYGFSPVGTTSDEATDEYESVSVVSKVKGLSSLPSIPDVRKKVAAAKNLTVSDTLIFNALGRLEGLEEAELTIAKNDLVPAKRALEKRLAGFVYTLVLGRRWFGDDAVITTELDFGDVKTPVKTQMTLEKTRKMVAV